MYNPNTVPPSTSTTITISSNQPDYTPGSFDDISAIGIYTYTRWAKSECETDFVQSDGFWRFENGTGPSLQLLEVDGFGTFPKDIYCGDVYEFGMQTNAGCHDFTLDNTRVNARITFTPNIFFGNGNANSLINVVFWETENDYINDIPSGGHELSFIGGNWLLNPDNVSGFEFHDGNASYFRITHTGNATTPVSFYALIEIYDITDQTHILAAKRLPNAPDLTTINLMHPIPHIGDNPAPIYICSGESFDIDPADYGDILAGTTYTWTVNSLLTSVHVSGYTSGGASNLISGGPLTNSSYTQYGVVTYDVIATSGNCTTTTRVHVRVRPAFTPGAIVGDDKTICSGSTVPINITEGAPVQGGNQVYEWQWYKKVGAAGTFIKIDDDGNGNGVLETYYIPQSDRINTSNSTIEITYRSEERRVGKE
jgi:hypothetical protein